MAESKGKVLLVAFYNIKAQGVRYLETALESAGYDVSCVFYKDFNSVRPKKTTEAELDLLCGRIEQVQPLFIGLSVMSSMYLDTVNAVLERIKQRFDIPVLCGGAFTSMFPEYFLDRGAQFVIRTDGEHAIVRLADALRTGSDYAGIPSLGWRDGSGSHVNAIGDVLTQLDGYGAPVINSRGACFIENDKLVEGDPQLGTMSYETIASRGCPFQCSYCCCSNLRKLLPQGTPPAKCSPAPSAIKSAVRSVSSAQSISAPQHSLAAYRRAGVISVSSSLNVIPLCSASPFRLASTATVSGSMMASTSARL